MNRKTNNVIIIALLSLTLILPIAHAAITEAHYALENASDSSGNNRNMNTTGTVNYVPGALNNGASGWATANYLSRPHESWMNAMRPRGGGAISVWFIPNASGPTNYNTFVKKRNVGSTNGQWNFGTDNAGKIKYYELEGSYGIITSAATIVANNKYFMVLNFYTNGTAELWVNGSRDSSADFAAQSSNTFDLTIGGNDLGWPAANGVIDDLCFYNATLTATNISNLWNGGAGQSCSIIDPVPVPVVSYNLTLELNETRTNTLVNGFSYNLTNGSVESAGYCGSTSCNVNTNITNGTAHYNASGYTSASVVGVNFNSTANVLIIGQTQSIDNIILGTPVINTTLVGKSANASITASSTGLVNLTNCTIEIDNGVGTFTAQPTTPLSGKNSGCSAVFTLNNTIGAAVRVRYTIDGTNTSSTFTNTTTQSFSTTVTPNGTMSLEMNGYVGVGTTVWEGSAPDVAIFSEPTIYFDGSDNNGKGLLWGCYSTGGGTVVACFNTTDPMNLSLNKWQTNITDLVGMPDISRHNGVFYLLTTSEDGGVNLRLWNSTDLKNFNSMCGHASLTTHAANANLRLNESTGVWEMWYENDFDAPVGLRYMHGTSPGEMCNYTTPVAFTVNTGPGNNQNPIARYCDPRGECIATYQDAGFGGDHATVGYARFNLSSPTLWQYNQSILIDGSHGPSDADYVIIPDANYGVGNWTKHYYIYAVDWNVNQGGHQWTMLWTDADNRPFYDAFSVLSTPIPTYPLTFYMDDLNTSSPVLSFCTNMTGCTTNGTSSTTGLYNGTHSFSYNSTGIIPGVSSVIIAGATTHHIDAIEQPIPSYSLTLRMNNTNTSSPVLSFCTNITGCTTNGTTSTTGLSNGTLSFHHNGTGVLPGNDSIIINGDTIATIQAIAAPAPPIPPAPTTDSFTIVMALVAVGVLVSFIGAAINEKQYPRAHEYLGYAFVIIAIIIIIITILVMLA